MRKWVFFILALVLVVNLVAIGVGCKRKTEAPKPEVKEEVKPPVAPAPPPAAPAPEKPEEKPEEAPKK